MKKNQAGYSFWGLLVVLVILGFCMLSLLKVFPVYMEHMSVSKSLETLENDPKISRMATSRVHELLMKKFDMNAVTAVNGSHVKILRTTEDINVKVTYQVRKHFFSNIDLVFSFNDEFTVVNKSGL